VAPLVGPGSLWGHNARALPKAVTEGRRCVGFARESHPQSDQYGEPGESRVDRDLTGLMITPAWSLAFVGSDAALEAGRASRRGHRVTFDNET
jgi:hypothetical protein